MVINSLFNAFSFLKYDDSISYNGLRRIRRDVEYYFGDNMPKKYWIFSIKPYIYTMSNTICIKIPSYGNKKYRELLYKLEYNLKQSFKCDVELFDGYTTFVIRENKKFYDDEMKEMS